MKKLMFAATAALCATVGLAELTSANIVGYQSIDLEPGQQVIRGAMFKNTVGEGLDLQAIKMDDATVCDGGTMMWWWNGAKYDTKAYWVPACDADGNYINDAGEIVADEADAAKVWGDGESWIAIEKTFKKGECFWIQPHSDNETSAIVPSGSLVTSDKTVAFVAVPLNPGQQEQVTSPMPFTSLSLSDIELDDSSACDGGTMLWWWNGVKYDAKAYWVPACDADGNYINDDGEIVSDEADAAKVWGDGESWVEISKTFSAGEGFWVQPHSDNEASSLLFKNPLYTAE